MLTKQVPVTMMDDTLVHVSAVRNFDLMRRFCVFFVENNCNDWSCVIDTYIQRQLIICLMRLKSEKSNTDLGKSENGIGGRQPKILSRFSGISRGT